MQKSRPLSPHLQVYKPQLTSMLSFLHRSTGVFLSLGTPLLVFWLWTLAAGPHVYGELQAYFTHWFARLVLFGWTFALFFHLCNGIRHLFWDVGKGYELNDLYASGRAVMLSSIMLTMLAWFLAYARLGGA